METVDLCSRATEVVTSLRIALSIVKLGPNRTCLLQILLSKKSVMWITKDVSAKYPMAIRHNTF